ncbi:MAG: L-threonylcarbamoyladenylate synthase [Pseudomonadales bacterium]
MSQFLQIHPEDPQARLIATAADIVARGGVIAYPTDSAYALGCHIGDKAAMEKIRQLRQLDKAHNFTLMVRDLSELAVYAKVDNSQFRTLKLLSPGPYTFILPATREVPRRLMHPKRKTIGLRVPDNPIALALLEKLGEPLMSVTLIMPGDDEPLIDPYEMRGLLGNQLDLVIDGGYCGMEPTTIVSFEGGETTVVRHGKGSTEVFSN